MSRLNPSKTIVNQNFATFFREYSPQNSLQRKHGNTLQDTATVSDNLIIKDILSIMDKSSFGISFTSRTHQISRSPPNRSLEHQSTRYQQNQVFETPKKKQLSFSNQIQEGVAPRCKTTLIHQHNQVDYSFQANSARNGGLNVTTRQRGHSSLERKARFLKYTGGYSQYLSVDQLDQGHFEGIVQIKKSSKAKSREKGMHLQTTLAKNQQKMFQKLLKKPNSTLQDLPPVDFEQSKTNKSQLQLHNFPLRQSKLQLDHPLFSINLTKEESTSEFDSLTTQHKINHLQQQLERMQTSLTTQATQHSLELDQLNQQLRKQQIEHNAFIQALQSEFNKNISEMIAIHCHDSSSLLNQLNHKEKTLNREINSLTSEMTVLRMQQQSKLQQYESECNKLDQSSIDLKLQNELEQLRQTMVQIEVQYAESRQQTIQLQEKQEQLLNSLKELSASNGSKDQIIRQLHQQAEMTKEEHDKQINMLQEKLVVLNEQMTIVDKEKRDLGIKMAKAAKEQIQKVNTDRLMIKEMKKQIDTQKKQIEQAKEEIEARKINEQQLTEQLTQCSGEKQKLQKKIAKSNSTVKPKEEVQSEMASLLLPSDDFDQKQTVDLLLEIEKLKKQLEEQQSTNKFLTNDLNSQLNLIETLKVKSLQKQKLLQKEISDLKEEIMTRDELADQMEQKIVELESQIEDLQEQEAVLQTKVQELQRKQTTSSVMVDIPEESSFELQKEELIEELNEQITSLTYQVNEITQEKVEIQTAHKAEIQEINELCLKEITELEENAEKLHQRIAELEEQLLLSNEQIQ